MDQVAIKALDAQPIQLLVLGMALLALAILAQAWVNSRSTDKLVGVLQSQVKSNGDLTAVTAKQTDALRREQDLREAQISATATVETAVKSHDGRSDERSKALLEKMDTVTDLVGEAVNTAVNSGADRVMAALKPLSDGLKEIKASLEAAQQEAQAQQEKQALVLGAIETKVELVSEQFVDVIQIFGEMSDEDEQHTSLGGDGPPDAVVSAGAASGSATGNGTGHTGDSGGTSGG